MRYLGLALIREGTSDNRFLSELIQRLIDEICLRKACEQVEISPINEILAASKRENFIPMRDRLIKGILAARGSFDLLFIHVDGDGDPQKARAQHVGSLIDGIKAHAPEFACEHVAIIPIREMEAWAIIDGDALRQAFQTTLTDDELEIVSPIHQVEQIYDPKRKLEDALRVARGGRKSRGKQDRAGGYLDLIGKFVSLDKLRHLPAFQEFESELNRALGRMCIIADNQIS